MTFPQTCGRPLGVALVLVATAWPVLQARAQAAPGAGSPAAPMASAPAAANGHGHGHSHSQMRMPMQMQGHAQGQASASAGSPPAGPSAFEGYRRFTDAPPTDWRSANETVGRIGGWRAYAREAQGAESAPAPGAAAAGGHSHEGVQR